MLGMLVRQILKTKNTYHLTTKSSSHLITTKQVAKKRVRLAALQRYQFVTLMAGGINDQKHEENNSSYYFLNLKNTSCFYN